MGSVAEARITLSLTFVVTDFTTEKNCSCNIKFVKWFVQKNRTLSMSQNDDELNEFIDEVTDGSYNLNSDCTSCRRDKDFHHL